MIEWSASEIAAEITVERGFERAALVWHGHPVGIVHFDDGFWSLDDGSDIDLLLPDSEPEAVATAIEETAQRLVRSLATATEGVASDG